MSEKEDVMSTNSFTEEEQRFASDAYQAFTQGQYDSCITTLKKIQKNHPGDCKLIHNRAIVDFYKSGQTKTSDLKRNLAKVYKVTQQSHQEDEDATDESVSSEYSVLHFNQSVLYYHLHQYTEAQALLETLAENADSTNYCLLEIYLLLAEIYLINYEPEKAGRIMLKLEDTLPKPTSPQGHHSKSEGKEKGKHKSSSAFSAMLKTALPLMKTRCSLQMKSMKACKRELKAFANVEGTSELSTNTHHMLSVFLKSNFEFQRGNFFKAYKLLGSCLPSSALNHARLQNGECIMTMFYNNLGVIHFHVGKYNLGTFYLMKAIEENDKAINTSSKKGDVKHQQQGSGSSSVKTLQMLNTNKKFELLYNMGIQLLFSGKPSAAFDCLILSAQVFYSNPRLWLRLAECCIQVNSSEEKCEDSGQNNSRKNRGGVSYSVVGSGIHQKLVVHPLTSQWSGTGNAVMPGATLEFASVCLQNALTILTDAGVGNNGKEKRKQGSKAESEKKVECSVACFPSPPVSGQEMSSLHASILANSAFVALGLGNNLMAYEYSKTLLQLSNLSGRHKYLGRMYSAEALVCLDRIADAIQQLSNENVTDIGDTQGDASSNSSKNAQQNMDDTAPSQTSAKSLITNSTQICFKSLRHAQGCMILNLATAHCLRSEFEKAQKLLTQFASMVPIHDIPPNAILLSMYINLHTNGGLPIALKVLQHNTLLPHLSNSRSQLAGNAYGLSGMKPLASVAASNQSSTPSVDLSSNGSISGGSSGSRSKSSTPLPQYSGPPSGSVTPERMVKGSQQTTKPENSKTKRSRR